MKIKGCNWLRAALVGLMVFGLAVPPRAAGDIVLSEEAPLLNATARPVVPSQSAALEGAAAITTAGEVPAIPAAAIPLANETATAAGGAREAAPTVAQTAQVQTARLAEVTESVAGGLQTAQAANSAAGASKAAGGEVQRALSGEKATPVSAVAAAPTARAPQSILEKLGLRDKILAAWGVEQKGGKIKPVKKPLKFGAYDNDDNIAYYRTKIYVQNKDTGEEAAIPTAEFAEVRPFIGKSGKYANYKYFDSPEGGSFRDFRDIKEPNIFAKDAADAIDSTHSGMFRGPAWFNFALAMKDPKTAALSAIVTSRGHEPAAMVRGFEVFKEHGFIKNTPREELMFGVSSPELVPLFPKEMGTPEKKVEVLISLLDLLDTIPLTNPRGRHTFTFSDDDLDMATRVKDRLLKEQAGGRWKRVKITVLSTGLGTEGKTKILPSNKRKATKS